MASRNNDIFTQKSDEEGASDEIEGSSFGDELRDMDPKLEFGEGRGLMAMTLKGDRHMDPSAILDNISERSDLLPDEKIDSSSDSGNWLGDSAIQLNDQSSAL